MATMKVCRVCLAMNVKMYHMSEHKLSDIYKRVTGVKINTKDKLPRMLCWECVARLSTANNFIVKAFKTHSIFMKQLNSSKVVTVSDIESINRVHYKLASTLGFKDSKENNSNLYVIKENDEDNDDDEEREPVSYEINDIDTSISIKDEQIITETNIGDENFTFKSEYLESSVEQNVPDENFKEANIIKEKDQNENTVIRSLENSNEDNISDEEMTIDNMSNVTDMFERKHHTMGEATGIFEEIKHNVTVESNLGCEMLPRCKELRVVVEDIMVTLSKYNTQDTLKQVTAQSSKDSSTAAGTVAGNKRFLQDDSETSNVFICDICDKEFDIKSTLIRHIMEHSIQVKKIQVKICNNINAKHTKKISFNCSFCSYKTYRQSDLSEHINAKHTKDVYYNCSHCPYKTYRRRCLSKHINAKHTQTIVYNCPHCIYIAYERCNLIGHVNAKHTKTKVYNCSLCSYKAYKKSDLSSHINGKHSKSISYKCSHCSYEAYHRGNLNKHINSKHTKTDVFYCSLCSHKTYRKSNLIVHVKTKHAGTC